MSAIAMPVFTTDVISIKDLKVINRDKTTGKKSHSSIEVNGEELNAGGRFWNSLFSRYGFNQQFFKYFKEDVVFDRICNTEKNDKLRICVERNSRVNLLKGILTFYRYHCSGFGELKSLEVLEALYL